MLAKESLVVASKVKAQIKAMGCMCSSEVMDALNECVDAETTGSWICENSANETSERSVAAIV